MLLILVLALLFCPSLAEEELRGVKQKKYAYFVLAGNTIYTMLKSLCEMCSVNQMK